VGNAMLKFEYELERALKKTYFNAAERTNCGDSYNKSQQDALFLKFILIKNSACFGQIYCPSSGVSTLYTQQ
jgi:hypothetical protein